MAAEGVQSFAELAERNGYDLARSYAYSDSITDVHMLEIVGHPHAVNPDKELRRQALNRWIRGRQDVDAVVAIETEAFSSPWRPETFAELIDRPTAELLTEGSYVNVKLGGEGPRPEVGQGRERGRGRAGPIHGRWSPSPAGSRVPAAWLVEPRGGRCRASC